LTREELEHAIKAACDVAGEDAVYVFGSQAILGRYPDAPPELRQSMECDVAPVTRADRADDIDGALGELSLFHEQFGFYVQGLTIDAAKLPRNWKKRVVPVRVRDGSNVRTGLCIEPHDLAASKLAAFRDKDRDYVRILLQKRLIRPTTLMTRIRTLEIPEIVRGRLLEWVKLTATAA
jgi:hypothetical protein